MGKLSLDIPENLNKVGEFFCKTLDRIASPVYSEQTTPLKLFSIIDLITGT